MKLYVHSLVDKLKWFYENARCYNKISNKILVPLNISVFTFVRMCSRINASSMISNELWLSIFPRDPQVTYLNFIFKLCSFGEIPDRSFTQHSLIHHRSALPHFTPNNKWEYISLQDQKWDFLANVEFINTKCAFLSSWFRAS